MSDTNSYNTLATMIQNLPLVVQILTEEEAGVLMSYCMELQDTPEIIKNVKVDKAFIAKYELLSAAVATLILFGTDTKLRFAPLQEAFLAGLSYGKMLFDKESEE